MADYRQADVIGTSWRRCCGIDIHNPLGKPGQVTFREQDLAVIGGQPIQLGTGNLTISVDLGKTFPVLDPATGEATERRSSHAELYVLLYSAYLAEAAERDVREAEAARGATA